MQNCKSRIQWIRQILFVPHQYIYIYIYRERERERERERPHVGKHEVQSSGTLYYILLI